VTTTAPAGRKPIATARWVWRLTDDFSDGSFDSTRWTLWRAGTGVRSSEQNDRLEFSLAADAVPDANGDLSRHYGTICTFLDDFDAQVDFRLVDWPAGDGVKLSFGAYFGASPDDAFWAVSRQGRTGHGGAEAYLADVRSSHGFVETADVSGTLRVAREHDILSLSFRGRQGWVQLASGFEPRYAALILRIEASGDDFGQQAATAAFENFQATSASVFCPGPYVPERIRIKP
jgi:hypothetical protein